MYFSGFNNALILSLSVYVAVIDPPKASTATIALCDAFDTSISTLALK
jgi:hypothetical protein